MTTIDNMYSEENIPSSNWMKFNNIGDACKGVFKEKFNKQGDGAMPDQIVFVLDKAFRQELEIKDGKPVGLKKEENIGTINVGIKATNTYILNRLNNLSIGQAVAFAFTEEIKPSKAGFNPAKSIQPYVGKIDEEYIKNLGDNSEDISVDDIPF